MAQPSNGNRETTPPRPTQQTINSNIHLATPKRTRSETKLTPRRSVTDANKKPLPDARPRIAIEMGSEFLTCEINELDDHYLPYNPSDALVDACVENLLVNCPPGDLQPFLFKDDKGKLNFSACQEEHFTEDSKIRHLKPLAKALENQIVEGRQARYHYVDCPNTTMNSNIPGSTHKIDACFTADPEGIRQCSTTAVSAEYKLKAVTKDIHDNNIKVTSASVQIMNDDVSRVFCYGMTIEDYTFRFWCFTRSHSVVSKSFDYSKNPRLLIKIFLSFIFATPTEIGYDPTITHHGDRVYTYNVSGRFYRTIKIIDEYRSHNVTGRMSRIWLVEEVVSNEAHAAPKITQGDTHRVLKDVWLEEKSLTERQIQDAIFQGIKDFWESPQHYDPESKLNTVREKYADLYHSGRFKEYFLTIETDGVGSVTKSFPPPCRKQRGLFSIEQFRKDAEKEQTSLPGGERTASSLNAPPSDTHPRSGNLRGVPSDVPEPQVERSYVPRKQYRVVFEEVCVALGDLEKLGEVVDLLEQTLIPLQLLFCAGWVHRDISSGNILALKTPNHSLRVKLADMEYARQFPLPDDYEASSDPKTGTPFFMPYEIVAGRYLQPKIVKPEDTMKEILGEVSGELLGPDKTGKLQRPKQGVEYNFQHDLEPIWWILLWVLMARINHRPSLDFAQRIFRNTLEVNPRGAVFLDDTLLYQLRQCLKEPLQIFVLYMEGMRRGLVNEYSLRVRQDRLYDLDSYVEVYNKIQVCFSELCNAPIQSHTHWRDVPLDFYSLEDDYDIGHPASPGSSDNEPVTKNGNLSTIPDRSTGVSAEHVPSVLGAAADIVSSLNKTGASVQGPRKPRKLKRPRTDEESYKPKSNIPLANLPPRSHPKRSKQE